MKPFIALSIILFVFFFEQNSLWGQCNIVPTLTSSSLYDGPGNTSDYFVVCTQGSNTGALIVGNGIASGFLNSFNSYTINWGDGSPVFTTTSDVFQNPAVVHEYSVGNYILTFSATTASCTVTNQYNVYVGNTPSVSMGSPGGTEGCSEVTISFPISNASQNIPTTTYSVTYSDGSPQENFTQPPPATVSHTFNESSCGETFLSLSNSYGVTVIASNECGQAQVSVAPVRISAPPVADFSVSAETICTSGTITFDDSSDQGTTATSSGCGSNARFYWSLTPATGWTLSSGTFGSNNGLPNTLSGWTTGTDQVGVNFTSPGTYTMTLNYRNSCGPSSKTRTICVVSPPTCGFNVNTDSGCGPLSVVTNNTSTGPSCGNTPLALSHSWTVNVPSGGSYTVTNGSLSSANPTFNLTNTGTSPLVYTLTLQVSIVNPQTGVALASCSSSCQKTITVYPAPVVSTQPTPTQTICVGGTPNPLSVAYQYGVGTPTYQWYSNTANSNSGGTLISGATSSSYSPPTLNTAGNYYYYAVISLGGTCGTITSNPACVSVVPDPTISTQPTTPQTICSGGTAASVSMAYTGGTGTPSYQWFSNSTSTNSGGTAVSGATSSSFTPTVPSTPGNYYFYGTVSLSGSGCNAVATNITAVTVISDPTITINGSSPTYCQNAPTSPLATTVSGGSGNNTYQWFQNSTNSNSGGTPISGQTGATFSPPTTTVGTQYYYVQLTQAISGCSNVSAPMQVEILPAASISTQPQPSTVCLGGSATPLSVAYVNGSGTPTYQWYSNTTNSTIGGTSIAGATNATFNPPTSSVGTIYYYAVVSFTSGGCSNITSAAAAVNVVADPTVNAQPTATQTLCVGGSLSTPLSVTASGGIGTLSYQWYSTTTSSNSGGVVIAGASGATYTPPSQNTAGNYYYYVTVSSSGSGCETTTSTIAQLSVITDPTVTAPTATQTVCQGAPATALTVSVAGGSGTNSYTWYSNTANSTTGGTSVGTSASYTPVTTSVGTLYYYVTVSQSVPGCAVTSAVGQVVVTPAASITTQPSPSTVCVGGTATALTITHSTGIGTPTYQWYSSTSANGSGGTAISGATSISYTPPTSQAGTTYYYIVVSFTGGGCNDLTSNTAAVNVLADPTVAVSSNSPITVCAGTSLASPLSFTVQGGTGTISYQWYSSTTASTSNGTSISGATNSSYSPPIFNQSGSYYFYATVIASGNGCDATNTPSITVVVNQPATASVTGPYTTCGSASVAVSASSNGSGQWSAPNGSGAFSSPSSANTSFTPSSSSPQSITLTWTTADPDGSGPCPSVSANTTVTIYAPATASLLATGSVCTNSIISLNATTNSPGSWTTSGSGSFSNSTSSTTAYTPALADVGASPITLTWTTNDPDGSGPCVSVSASQSVSVFAPPVVSAGLDQVLCLNTPQVVLSGTPSGGTWSGTSVGSNGAFNPNQVGSYTLTYSYTDVNGCSLSDQMILNVNQSAIADANGPYFTCGISPVQISANTNGLGSWTGGLGAFGNSNSATTTYTPALSEVGSTITLTWQTFDPDNSGPCSGATDTAQLTVSTPATATIGGPYSICSSDVANLQVTSSPSSGTWSGGVGSFGSASQQSTTYDPSSSEGGTTVNITWTTTDPDGSGPCTALAVSTAVNVLEAAIADANGPYATCGVSQIQISATTNGNGTWSGGSGTFTNATSASTTYTPALSEVGSTITLTWQTFDPDNNGPCSGATDTAQLTVSTPATATIGGPYSICSSDVANLQVTSSPSSGTWSGGAGSFGSASQQSTTYDPSSTEGGTTLNITWTTTDPDGSGPCTALAVTTTVNVLEAAIADANGPYATCGVTQIQISATTNGNGTWSGGSGTFTNATNASTTYTPASSEVGSTITLTWQTFDPDGSGPCLGASDEATLNVSTPAVVTPGGPYAICSNGVAEVSVVTLPEEGSWSGGSGTFSSASSGSSIYTPGNADVGNAVILTWTTVDPDDAGPCLPVSADVVVNVLEEATAVITGPLLVCANETVNVEVQANGPGEWSITPSSLANLSDQSSTSTVLTPSVPSNQDQTLQISWTTFDPDGDGPCASFTTTESFLIASLPVIALQASYTIDCGDPISATASGGSGEDYQYEWSPVVGLISPNASTTPVNASGSYTLLVTDSNGCSSESSTDVSINALDQMAAAPDVETCLFQSVSLQGEATLGLAPFTYTWSPGLFLNVANSSNVEFTYNGSLQSDSLFSLTFSVTDALGCSDNETVEVTVHPLPMVVAGTDIELCADESSFQLSDYSPLESTGISGEWSPSQNIDPGSLPIGINEFTYTFTDFNSCTNSDELLLTVHEVPIADFDVPLSVCEGQSVLFSNQSSCATCGLLSYSWQFGNSNQFIETASPNYVFSDTGFVNVTLVVLSDFGCVDSITKTIHVLALPETGFLLDVHSGCGPLEVLIDNTTVGAELTYAWSIDPFGPSSIAEPGSVSFPEAPCDSIFYSIILTASNICGAVTVTDSVLVYSKPYPEFILSSDTICSSLPVSIYNSTQCAWNTTYAWDLGDGTISNSQELSIDNTYFADQAFASFDVVLTATNECGTRDVAQTITVVPNSITAFFNANPVSGCEPLEVNYDQEMFGVTYFSWDFGDGTNASTEDPSHVFVNPGEFETVFIAGNFCGAQDTAYQTITVLPAPVFEFEVSDQFLCVGEATDFAILGNNISGFEWDFGDGGSSNSSAPSHIYSEEGIYEVSLTAISTVNGCPATYTNDVEVILTPTAVVTSDVVAGCSPLLVNFQNETTDAFNYFWNLGDGNQYIGDSLSYSFVDPGVYSVQVVAINSNSCSDTVNVDITVYPKPTAAFNISTQDLDEYLRVTFQNQSLNAVAYQWNFGDGSVSFIANPAYRYTKLGDCDYTPFLVAYNEFGCTDTAYRNVLLSFEMRVWAPNSFTPNDDGLNDRFTIETIDVDPTTARLAIFDRWGVLVHESVGLYPGWDGKIDGEYAPNDAYVWRLYARTKCGYEDKSWVGHVIVIR